MTDDASDRRGQLRRSPHARALARQRVERTLERLGRGSPRDQRLAERIRRDVRENGR